jgi:hypothetical protein
MLNKLVIKKSLQTFVRRFMKLMDEFEPCNDCKDEYDACKQKVEKDLGKFFAKSMNRR